MLVAIVLSLWYSVRQLSNAGFGRCVVAQSTLCSKFTCSTQVRIHNNIINLPIAHTHVYTHANT